MSRSNNQINLDTQLQKAHHGTFDPMVNAPWERGNPRPGGVHLQHRLCLKALWCSWGAPLNRLPHRGQVAHLRRSRRTA